MSGVSTSASVHQTGASNPFAKTAVKIGKAVLTLPTEQLTYNYPPSKDTFKIVAPSSQTPNWSGYADFQVDNGVIDVLHDIVFILNVGALSVTGGTYSRFMSGAENFLQRTEVYAGDQLVETIYPESITTRNLLLNATENKNRFYRLLGNDTSANLVTAAASAQSFFISIPSFYNTGNGFFMKGIAVPLRFRFYLANLQDVVVTNGTTPVCAINSVSLRAIGRDFDSQSTVQALIANQRQAGSYQFRYLIPVQQQRNNLVLGTNSYSINLSSMIGYFSHLVIIIRAASSITTPLANDYNAYLPLSKFSVKNSSGSIIPSGIEIDSSFNILYENNFYWTGDATDINSGLGGVPKNVYTLVFSERPESAHKNGTASGGYQLTGLGENLNLTFSTALSANYVCDIIGFKYTFLNLDNKGVITRIDV